MYVYKIFRNNNTVGSCFTMGYVLEYVVVNRIVVKEYYLNGLN